MRIRFGALICFSASLALLTPTLQAQVTFNAADVANDASGVIGPIVPGGLTAINNGTQLSTIGTFSCEDAPLNLACGLTTVLVNGQDAPVAYVSFSKVTFQAPVGLTGPTATIQVFNRGIQLYSPTVTVNVTSISPGLYTTGGYLNGLASGAFSTAAGPVQGNSTVDPGTTVSILGTGFGPFNPPAATGALPSAGATVAANVTARVAGQPVAIQATPDTSVGRVKITLTVPSGISGTVPLVVTAGGVDSNTVGLPVSGGTGNPVPMVSQLQPASATVGGASFTLTVVGTGFISGSQVLWNGSARSTTFISSTGLQAAISAADIAAGGNASITVFNPPPGGGTSNSLGFAVVPDIPYVTSISPSQVLEGSAAFTLTVNGTTFRPGASVLWNTTGGNVTALTTTFVSPTQLTAVVAASLIASPGSALINVKNPDGSNAQATTSFIINAPVPSINSLSPNWTVAGGGLGVELTVTGTNFFPDATVQWGGTDLPTSLVTFGSASQLTVMVPPSSIPNPGSYSVAVKNFLENPASATSNPLTFQVYAAPSISSLSPNSATVGGPAFTLVVNGSGFVPGEAVLWNGSSLQTSYVNAVQLTASVPASLIASPFRVNITVAGTYGGGTSNALSFLVNAPTQTTISSVNPTSAIAGGPAFLLTVNGSGFLPGLSVQWNAAALSAVYVSANQCTASIPASLIASSGTASITVANPGGAASNAVIFPIVAPVPAISSLSPNSATAGGPQFILTVSGSGFLAGSIIEWNGSALPTTYVSGTQLTATVAASLLQSAGGASIAVVNPTGAQSGTATFAINSPLPVISSLSPNSAPAGGAAFTLTVTGSGFLNGSIVQWNGPGLATSYVSGSQLTASVTASLIADVGTASVIVVNPGGASSSASTFAISTAPGLSIATASPLAAGTVGVPYSAALVATAGAYPYKGWSVTGGSLPPGISLSMSNTDQSGQLDGLPTTPGTFTFTVQVTDNANTSAAKQFTITVAGTGVSISAGGIVNSASYASGSVAPGEIVAIFGSALGPAALTSLELDNHGYVSTTLAGTQVFFDEWPAPIVYAQAASVSVVVPYEVAGQNSTQVRVVYQSQNSNTVTVPISAVMPGIFTMDASGRGPGAIVNPDGTVNSPDNPVPAGSYVSVYATGEGQTTPTGIDGKLGDWPAPLPVEQPVTATVGGVPADVQYAGGAPGLIAGMLQVNVLVPPAVATGASVPIVLTIGGQDTQAGVTLAIR